MRRLSCSVVVAPLGVGRHGLRGDGGSFVTVGVALVGKAVGRGCLRQAVLALGLTKRLGLAAHLLGVWR